VNIVNRHLEEQKVQPLAPIGLKKRNIIGKVTTETERPETKKGIFIDGPIPMCINCTRDKKIITVHEKDIFCRLTSPFHQERQNDDESEGVFNYKKGSTLLLT